MLLLAIDKSRALVRGIKQRRATGLEGIEKKRKDNVTELEIMSTKKIYDATPEQREIALWRDAKRRQLREMYLRDTGHPTKSLLVCIRAFNLTYRSINIHNTCLCARYLRPPIFGILYLLLSVTG